MNLTAVKRVCCSLLHINFDSGHLQLSLEFHHIIHNHCTMVHNQVLCVTDKHQHTSTTQLSFGTDDDGSGCESVFSNLCASRSGLDLFGDITS